MSIPFLDLLNAVAPKCPDKESWVAPLQNANLNSDTFNYFLAQGLHETAGLVKLEENLNYKTAGRLLAVFPRKFKTLGDAAPFVNNPDLLDLHVYDGYCGRGLLHMTWKENYKLCGTDLGIDLVKNPGLLLMPEFAVASAAWFWRKNKIAEAIEKANSDLAKCDASTRIINGKAMMHAKERFQLYLKIKELRG
jgi:putative chitinase